MHSNLFQTTFYHSLLSDSDTFRYRFPPPSLPLPLVYTSHSLLLYILPPCLSHSLLILYIFPSHFLPFSFYTGPSSFSSSLSLTFNSQYVSIPQVVESESGSPLSSVLLSLSGSHGFRSNNFTKPDGTLEYRDLVRPENNIALEPLFTHCHTYVSLGSATSSLQGTLLLEMSHS